MLTGIVILTGLAASLGVVLSICGRYLRPSGDSVADQLERLLPRIQCAQCGFPGCRAYAEAMARDNAAINRCPPGGTETIRDLANALGCAVEPLDTSLGTASLSSVARIEESLCIGCNLCARICPVDAIVGIAQMMHTVIREHCTGCELCLAPCPVDCITLDPRDG